MRYLPLKYQILLAPAVVLALIVALIWFTVSQLQRLNAQNETVRQWVRICSDANGAISSGQRLMSIAAHMEKTPPARRNDLYFNYLEQSHTFSDNLLDPELLDSVSANTRRYFRAQERRIRYQNDLDPDTAHAALTRLLPHLETVYTSVSAQKRAAYSAYYENVKSITARLVTVSLAVLAACILAGIALAGWTSRLTGNRLKALAANAKAICAGNLELPPPPTGVHDELDELAVCMSRMTRQLIHVVSTEKVLQGAEEERHRIAMDLHDQTLSDLTNITRDVRALRSEANGEPLAPRLACIENGLAETANNIRDIMDDLHPQVLDMLGLEAALRSYLDKRMSRPGLPAHQFHMDTQVEHTLSNFQRVMLYRIALEAIQNVVRHSHCSRYEIDCRLSHGQVIFSVEDNGIGLDETKRSLTGRGMANIEQRANALGASISWSPSRFSAGTRFELRLGADAVVNAPAADRQPA